MKKAIFTTLPALVCAMLFAGCGSIPVTDAVEKPQLKGDSIVVFVLRTTNSFKGWLVIPSGMTVEISGGPKNEKQYYTFYGADDYQNNDYAEYVVSLHVHPGHYVI